MSQFKNIAVIARKDAAKALESAAELCHWLKAKGINVYVEKDAQITGCSQFLSEEKIKILDLVVVLGGDGTYLQAARLLAGQKTPIIGINLGSLGFLTENRVENMKAAVEATLKGEMESRPRGILNIKIPTRQIAVLALNDLVVERGDRTNLINMAIYCDGHLVYETKADGIVVASPTGSTAYNLAAGGPILHPEVGAFVVTPICPHSLTSRPIIFPDDKVIELQLIGAGRDAQLTIDGQKLINIGTDDRIHISRHPTDHLVIRHPTHNFFNLLREKLKFGERN